MKLKEALETPEKTAEFRAELEYLKESKGWEIIVESLKEDVEEIEAKLHREVPMAEGDTFENLNDRRDDRLGLINLPDYLLKVSKKNKGTKKDFDPYEK